MNWRDRAATLRAVVRVLRENNMTFMAGSIAHAAFLSLLPLLLLLLIVTAAVGTETINQQIAELAQTYLSPTGEDLVFTALTEASERAGASLLGVASLLWGMLRVFRSLSTAFDELYGEEFTGPLQQVIDGAVVFVSILVATVGAALGVAVLALFDSPVVPFLTPLVLVAGLLVAFYPMYYFFPAPQLSPREPIPGAVVAAVGWVLLELVFGLYVDLVNTVSLYGILGSVILLLVWLYGIAFVLLIGAAVNVVLARRHGPEPTTKTEQTEAAASEERSLDDSEGRGEDGDGSGGDGETRGETAGRPGPDEG